MTRIQAQSKAIIRIASELQGIMREKEAGLMAAGIIPSPFTLHLVISPPLEGGRLGFYDPEADSIVIGEDGCLTAEDAKGIFLHELAHAQNYSVLLVGFLNRQPKDSDLLPLYKHSVDGIVILGSYGDLSWTDAFKETPIARIGHGTHPNLTLAIGIDEQDAMRKIFGHLAKDLGLKKIAYASRELAAHHMRRDAAEEAAKFFGCDYSCLPVSSETSDFKAGTNIARALMDKGRENLPQAIVCATDTIAMGIIKRFYECGVRVPEDVAIVGFDDISAAANYIPSITSFRQPVKLFAQKCFNVVSENVEPQILNVEGELLIRKSTMKL